MTTRAQMLARRDAKPVVVATVDGIGEYAGLWRFCSRRPLGYSSSALYKDWFASYPALLSQEANPLGGVADSGEVEISLVDVDDALLAKLRTEARPQTRLTSAITAAGTSATLDSATGITAGTTVLFVGSEAILVDSGANPYTVTRGALGTDAVAHEAGDTVHLYTPHLYGRRLRLYVTFDDPGYTVAWELEGEVSGGWSLDGVALGEGLNTWVLRARSQLRFLDRLLLRRSFRGYVGSISTDGTYFNLLGLAGVPRKYDVAPHFQDRMFFRLESGEIIRTRLEVVGGVPVDLGRQVVDLRGALGTKITSVEIGDEIRQVYAADPLDGYGSFRYQAPGGETSSLSTGTWISDAHPVVLLLALLTSAADPTHDTPDNWATDTGNFSALPGGVGIGIPVAEIDVESFFAVWQRTQSFVLDHLVIDESRTAREVCNEICRIVGFDLRQSGAQIGLDYYRSPLEGEGTTVWDNDVILVERDSEGVERPMLSLAQDSSLTAGSVVFRLRTPGGVEVESVFTDADFPALFGNTRGYYEQEDQRIEISASYVRADSAGAEPEVLRQRALQLLFRYRRPLWRVRVSTDLSQQAVEVGSLVQVTHAQFPDLATGTRGVTQLTGKVLSKQEVIGDDFVGIHWELIMSTSSTRLGRICPSGMISSVSTNDVTVAANRYSDPASRGDLPTVDAAGFTAGDVVRLTDRAGTTIATTPTTQIVQSVAGNVVTLDGNFGGSGSFAAGAVLEFTDRAGQVAQQYQRFVSMADVTARTVGASSDLAWGYAEP